MLVLVLLWLGWLSWKIVKLNERFIKHSCVETSVNSVAYTENVLYGCRLAFDPRRLNPPSSFSEPSGVPVSCTLVLSSLPSSMLTLEGWKALPVCSGTI